MKTCTVCGGSGGVVDSRVGDDVAGLSTTRRRRVCGSCGERWTTYEVHEDALADLLSSLPDDFVKSVMDGVTEALETAAQAHGVNLTPLKGRRENQSYTAADRKRVFDYVRHGFSVRMAARLTGVKEGTASKWVLDAGGAGSLRATVEAAE